MRSRINLVLVVIIFITFATSCKKDEESVTDKLSGLKAVVFPDKPDEVLDTKTLRDLGGGHREYLKLVKKDMPIIPVELVDESLREVINPGVILRGDAFMEGNYAPIATDGIKDITISISLQGKGVAVSKKAQPTISDIRQKVNDLITQEGIKFGTVPSYLKYYSHEVSTYESFNKTFRTHKSAKALFGLFKNSFSYEYKAFSMHSTKYLLIKVRQMLYNVSVDPTPPEHWGNLKNIGDYEPVYISSVDYGRVAHLLVQIETSAEETFKNVSGGISANFILGSAGGSTKEQEAFAKLFNDRKIEIFTAGGPLQYTTAIDGVKSFKEFLELPSPSELVESAVPIAYKVRTLKDNKEVEVHSFYTEEVVGRE